MQPELRRVDGLDGALTQGEILMWQVEEDRSRGFVVEEALLWARAVAAHSQQDSWVLVHVFRHPSGDNTWYRSVSEVARACDALHRVPIGSIGRRVL